MNGLPMVHSAVSWSGCVQRQGRQYDPVLAEVFCTSDLGCRSGIDEAGSNKCAEYPGCRLQIRLPQAQSLLLPACGSASFGPKVRAGWLR